MAATRAPVTRDTASRRPPSVPAGPARWTVAGHELGSAMVKPGPGSATPASPRCCRSLNLVTSRADAASTRRSPTLGEVARPPPADLPGHDEQDDDHQEEEGGAANARDV